MATGTIKAKYDVEQKTGNIATLTVHYIVGIAGAAQKIEVWIPFPFMAKNTNYSVAFISYSIDGIQLSKITNASVTNKTTSGFRVEFTIDSSVSVAYRTAWGVSGLQCNITFA